MQRNIFSRLGLMLAGLTLLASTAAAQTGPLYTAGPEYPTPYHTPLFHGGGASTPYPVTGIDPLIDPLFPQLQGTPTGYYPLPVAPGVLAAGTVPTQIPSSLLGDYVPALPPAVAGVYYPNHFADGNLYSWSAPFSYIPAGTGAFTLDDNQTTAIVAGLPNAGSVFATPTGTWQNITTGNVAGTATNGEYDRLIFGQPGSATWKLVASNPGSYSVFFHIPDNIDDGSGNVEQRNTNVTYLINITGSNPQSGAATVSQTEANSSQFLAGPFLLQTGDIVTVTLERTATINNLTDASGGVGQYDLIADSMSLQSSFGDVQSTPTAINLSAYPNEFKNVQYWGIAPNASPAAGGVAPVSATGVLATDVFANAPPDTVGGAPGGVAILHYGDPALAPASDAASTSTTPGLHLIRQLVYFGRSEPIFANQVGVDDSASVANGFTPNGFTTVVTPAPAATNNEYRTAIAQTLYIGPAATWTLTAPSAGSYSLSVNVPAPATTTEQRTTNAEYTVAVNAVAVGNYTVNQITQNGNVVLPTGSLQLAAGDVVTVTLSRQTNQPTTPTMVVVADSVQITTGTTKGAIYCVDGFTGSVVWRYEIPGSANGPSAPVFSSPAIARINVMVTPPVYTAGVITTPAVYKNKLVVIVGDNNGLVYCLDAVGNGDGTSNANAINLTTGQPIFGTQPAYGTGPVFGGAATPPSQTNIHVGTTGAYWIYRPDATRPKNVATGLPRVDTQGNPVLLPNNDLPVPAAFGTASPTVFVDPSVATTIVAPATALVSNALVYVGNSNGVLYALDAGGAPIDGATAATFDDTGDSFNVSQDLRIAATDPVVPTCQPKWWFSLRGPSPNSGANTSSADIESAPAIYVKTVATPVTVTVVQPGSPPTTTTYTTTYVPTVYIGSAHEQDGFSNVGRLYALNGLLGPSGNNGATNPATQPSPIVNGYTGPGSANYNVGQKPQTDAADTSDWTFPDALNTFAPTSPTHNFQHQSSTGLPRPALGNVTGSPVVFTNIHETVTNTNADGSPKQTRIYFAANSGIEIPTDSTTGVPNVRPDDTQTGRVWAVNLDGSVGTTTNSGAAAANGSNVWAYPAAWDPNNANFDAAGTAHNEPYAPIGSFLRSTPAIGYVQFPTTITTGDGTAYAPTDAVNLGGIKGNVVPMLYVGTRGVNDSSLYAVDIDGNMNNTGPTDQRTIYRQISPDGPVFQSSPVLITNSTTAAAGGNGGIVLITAGNTLYDFSATPISNPITPALGFTESYPLIREDRAYIGFGPISGPALAAADVTDLQGFGVVGAGTPGTITQQNVTDWVYVGDSTTGYCRGITPNDLSDANIPVQLGQIVPPDPNAPEDQDLTTFLRGYLVKETDNNSADPTKAIAIGVSHPIPAYEWGQNVYIRIANVVPPAEANGTLHYLRDPTVAPIGGKYTYYARGEAIAITISDPANTDPSTPQQGDTYTLPATVITQLPKNGFIPRSDAVTATSTAVDNLVEDFPELPAPPATPKQWIAAYTYAIGDGTGRHNTPGGHLRVDAMQTVHIYTGDGTAIPTDTGKKKFLATSISNGNEVTTQTGGVNSFKTVLPKDQPTFGILNPLGIRGGGIPLPLTNTPPPSVAAVQIGDDLGPFRGEPDSPVTPEDREALTNGNSVYVTTPDAGTGAGTNAASSITLQSAHNSFNPDSVPKTVVTSTPLIAHNTSGDNLDLNVSALPPSGTFTNGSNGLAALNFGFSDAPYSANIFDRSALGLVNKSISVKMGLNSTLGNTSNVGTSVSNNGGLYWNDNTNNTTGHDPVVNFLPWETPPISYRLGSANSSPDYPDISSQNITDTVHVANSGSVNVDQASATLQVAFGTGTVQNRTVYGSGLQIHISVPHYQPANQQLYKQGTDSNGVAYINDNLHEIPPLDPTSGTPNVNGLIFPMGYVTTRRIYVPTRSRQWQPGVAYRDITVYTGVPVDMSTSIVNPTTDVGLIPAAFGVQTELFLGDTTPYTPVPSLTFFSPYNTAFQDYFKPLEIHNDGNVNLLNVHMNQKLNSNNLNETLLLRSDSLDPLSVLGGYDLLPGITGPRTLNLPGTAVPEQPYLIRSSIDTDLVNAYGLNPAVFAQRDPNNNRTYLGATFHKPTPGGDAPSILTVPDSPTDAGSAYYLQPSSTGLPGGNQPAPPFVSLAVPFGTPVGTYSTAAPQETNSLRLFEGLDTLAATDYAIDPANPIKMLYPPQYGGKIGGVYGPTASIASNDIYSGVQPLSTIGTQLTATIVEQRLTDGATAGALPMIDATTFTPGTAATINSAGTPGQAFPDFAPAAFRDPATGNLSVYWTSGRSGTGYGIYGANVPFNINSAATPGNFFYPSDDTKSWWKPFTPISPVVGTTHSGLSTTRVLYVDPNVYAFDVAVTMPPYSNPLSYSNTLYCYPVTPATRVLAATQTVSNDPSQVKYGIKGIYTADANFTNNLWAFWTASTRGRTAIYYNSRRAAADSSPWPLTTGLLPIPAGLTSVADPSPILQVAPDSTGTLVSTLEVTYSGTGPDGNVDLYSSRYIPDGTKASQLNLTPYPEMTEILRPVTNSGWYQARDVAWSRTGSLNVFVKDTTGVVTPLLYTTTGTITPLFTKAIFDKASGLLVLTGVKVPDATGAANATTTNTVYVDAATGRVRFAPPLKIATTQNLQVQATFNPLAKRLTIDSRADTAPVTFLDDRLKPNATPGLQPVAADRLWTIWRKSGIGGDTTSATLYYKTQRLTAYLPTSVGTIQTITLNGAPYANVYDLQNVPPVYKADGVTILYPSSARIYFPIASKAEGATYSISYTDTAGATHTWPPAGNPDTVQWQDEQRTNDQAVPILNSIDGLNTVNPGYSVPIHTAVNENNVAAFLDPFASATSEHKVWLFWNSTRNGTADIYSETINPLF